MDAWVAGGSTATMLYRLGAAFDEVRTGAPAVRVVAVRGGTGAGRTSVLRAFYEYAAARQDDPPYWPPALASGADPVAVRDVIVPDGFTVTQGAELPWLWWGLSGREEFAALAGDGQIRRHTAGLQAALTALDGVTRRRFQVALDSVFIFGGLIPVVGSLLQAVDTASSTVALAGQAREAFQSADSRLDAALRNDATRRFTAHGDAQSAAADDGRLLALLTTVVPLLVVIDDADGLDEITLTLLNTLVRSTGARVLCVLAINTDHHATHPADPDDGDNEDLHGFLAGLHTQHRLEILDLAPFTDSDLATLARAQLAQWSDHDPNSGSSGLLDSNALARAVIAARGAPGRLATLLGSRAVRLALLSSGTLPENLTILAHHPATEDAWRDLPLLGRTGLAVLAVHGTATLTRLVDPHTLAAAAATGWVTTATGEGESITRFRSHDLYTTTDIHLLDQLTAEETTALQASLRDALLAVAAADTWATLPPDVILSLLERLDETDPNTPDTLRAALLRTRRASGLEPATTARLNQLAQRQDLTGVLRLASAEALADAGYQRRAVDLYTAELERITTKYGELDPRTLPTLHNLAGTWAAHAASLPQATADSAWKKSIEFYLELIAGYQRAMAKTGLTRRLPDTRLELAEIYHLIGLYHHEARAKEPTIEEYARTLGPDHPDTLGSRQNLATCYGNGERIREAITLLKSVVIDYKRTLGPDHPDTLSSQFNLATCSSRAAVDNHDARLSIEALTLHYAVFVAREYTLGPDHPRTLDSRNNLATCYVDRGLISEAITLFKAVLVDYERICGWNDRATLTTLDNLAFCYGLEGTVALSNGEGNGRINEAITLHEAVLVARERALAPDHPDILDSRINLAALYLSTDRTGEALTFLKAVLVARERTLGPTHPATLRSCRSYLSSGGVADDTTRKVLKGIS